MKDREERGQVGSSITGLKKEKVGYLWSRTDSVDTKENDLDSLVRNRNRRIKENVTTMTIGKGREL